MNQQASAAEHTQGRHSSVTASVVICAYTLERWDDLRAAVASVVAQLSPADECLVVIDHNEELLAEASHAFGGPDGVHVMSNADKRGLSGARNTGVAASRGELVAFLDDDATAGPGWLDGLRSALSEVDMVGAGSAVVPRWPGGARPAWFPPEFDWVVGCTYLGMPAHAADVRNVIGAGMAFRREVFELVGGFSTDVGRVGAIPTGCEETELCIRVRQAKPEVRIGFLPSIEVRHRVSADRLTALYFLRRCLGEGRSKARVAALVGQDAGLSSERSYVRRVLPRGVLRELARGMRGQFAGFKAAALIVAGLACAGFGYVTAHSRKAGISR
ncbi:glycosyltransferase family 2 protein [Allorhizocola rhizosphaerae]|uniref:glycosyltransferase family 2 protein n=1 Tax=Allorhizocola rhizosphaerae TaxID=1872709 RepID=UPI001B8B9B90|nr:glycosyltransferase family 2 protein [Allorhizocola rhizosphaerae]